MKALFAGSVCMALMAPPAFAGESPLPPGKPAGLHHAQMHSGTTIAVGVVVATAIAVILASATSGSAPVTLPQS